MLKSAGRNFKGTWFVMYVGSSDWSLHIRPQKYTLTNATGAQ